MKEKNPVLESPKRINAASENNATEAKTAPLFNLTAQLSAAPVQMNEFEEEEMVQNKKAPFQLQEMPEEEEEAQLKKSPFQLQEKEEDELQAKPAATAQVPQQSLEGAKSSKTSLPEPVQAQMESTMGADFSNVNIHKDSEKATGMGALAYAQGSDVHFAPGQFKPDTTSGQELIGHELAHVVQQREGRVAPTTQKKGQNVNDNAGLEQEADQMGREAAKKKK